MAKELKIWNGRGHGSKFTGGSFFVAAYSAKQASEILTTVAGYPVSVGEIRTYYSKGSWGNQMKGVIPTEPCLYATSKDDRWGTPKLVYTESSN